MSAVAFASLAAFASPASATSLEVQVRPAIGSSGDASPIVYEPKGLLRLTDPGPIFGDQVRPYGAGLLVQGAIGLRFGPYVSVGIDAGIRRASADAKDQAIVDLSRSAWNVGPYVRGYVPLVPFLDPWVSVGVQYVQDRQTWKAPFQAIVAGAGTQTFQADWTLEHHGIAVPLTVGVDWSLPGKLLAIGPSFQYAIVFPVGACATVNVANAASVKRCASDDENTRITTAKGYGVWSLGLNVRVTFPPP